LAYGSYIFSDDAEIKTSADITTEHILKFITFIVGSFLNQFVKRFLRCLELTHEKLYLHILTFFRKQFYKFKALGAIFTTNY